MEYTATAKYVRMSPRKVRLIARAVAGKSVGVALSALSALPKAAADPVWNVITSAVANAKAKKASVESLMVSTIDVMGGSAMKRWHAASRGMAHGYKKRMSHIKVVLKEEKKG